MAQDSEAIGRGADKPYERDLGPQPNEGPLEADIEYRSMDGSVSIRRTLFDNDEALYLGNDGVLVTAADDPTDIHETIFSRTELETCRELYVDGERALVRSRFLLWDSLQPDQDYERDIMRQNYEHDLEEYERKVEEGDISYVPNVGLYGFGGSSSFPSKPVDPTEPFYPRGLFTAMIIGGLLCLGIPALIELVALLLRP